MGVYKVCVDGGVARRCVWPGVIYPLNTPNMATEMGGNHPTRMHTCAVKMSPQDLNKQQY